MNKPRPPAPYQHIIWDWNGTLLDDVHLCLDVLNGLMRRRNLSPLTVPQYRSTFDFPVYDFYLQIGFDFSTESFEAVADEYIAGYTARLHESRLQPGARPTLDQLTAAGLTHSVLSAYQQDRLAEAVQMFQLTEYFLDLIGLNDYAAGSKLENGRRWVQKLPYQPHQIVFVGDTTHDFEVAQAIGVDCILLTTGHQHRPKLTPLAAPLVDSLTQLPTHLNII